MKKISIIASIGVIIILFPLLAFPPTVELWLHVVLGIFTIIFAFYEYVIRREKNTPYHPALKKNIAKFDESSHTKIFHDDTLSEE